MTAADERRGVGINERIGTITVLKGAVARLRAAGWRAAVIWLAIGGAAYATQVGFTALGVRPAEPQANGGYTAYALVSAAVSGAGVAWALRLLVQGRAAWLTFDRRFVECAGLLGALTLAFLAISGAYTAFAGAVAPDSGAAGMAGLGVGVAYLLAAYVSLKLTLWPVGRLTGRIEVTAARSWRLMRKATRGLILAYLLLLIPLIVVAGAAMAPIIAAGGEARGLTLVVLQFSTAAFSLVAYAMTATLYALRVEAPATVADVFA